MQITGILMLAIQIGFAVHALRRGYSLFWVFLIIFVPLIGCLLYIIMVLLPEAAQSRAAHQGGKALRKALDPDKELRQLREALDRSGTVGNRVALAQEYLKRGQFGEAIPLYEASLTGMYRDDPELLLGLTQALCGAGEFERARTALESLRAANPDHDSADTRLLYARVLEELGATEPAMAEYAALLQKAPSAEAKCRYGLLLKRAGREAEARPLLEEVVKDAKGASQHSYRLNREWVERAKRELG
jgi:hypothetical protein